MPAGTKATDGSVSKNAGGLGPSAKRGFYAAGIPTFASRRPFEELLTAMRKGADMLKHGRQGKPKVHFFRLAESDKLLTWRSAKGTIRSVALRSVTQVVPGQTTEIFRRYPNPAFRQLSFSLLYADGEGRTRTLDLTAYDEQTFELWFGGLLALLDYLHVGRSPRPHTPGGAEQPLPPAAGAVGLPFSGPDGMLAKSPVATSPLSASHGDGAAKVALQNVGGGTAQGRVTGAVGLPVPDHPLGDCYMWGTARPRLGSQGGARPQQRDLQPHPINDATHLDIIEVAAGLSHAGLLTRGGEMYAWGDGGGGKLGLGHREAAEAPERVHTLWGQAVRHIAVSDSCSAAITAEGRLWTWGETLPSSLAHAGGPRQYIPRPVAGPLTEHVVVQVSCGPFHSAAVTSDGCLFTWGEGLCGKLGHGDQLPQQQPRQVEALRDRLITHVACGTWHTAAVASRRPAGPESLEGLPFIERLTLRHKLATVYELTEEDDGSLYTWGCYFGQGRAGQPGATGSPVRADEHRGCLGTGDRSGRLRPSKVAGALDDLAVTGIAVGAAFTLAVTSDGRVWQMGETGTQGCEWEGALAPCQVEGQLAQHFAHSVSAGRHHAAVLAAPLNGATGAALEGAESTVILTWGRGSEGQLGRTGHNSDFANPAVVEELRGRRVLQVACGAFQTLAVCLHDPMSDDTEERRRGYKAKMKHWFGAQGRTSIDLPPSRADAEAHKATAGVAASGAPGKPHHGKGALEARAPSLRKTLSGSGLLVPVPSTNLLRAGGRRMGSTASEVGQAPSGLSTPTQPELRRAPSSADGMTSEPSQQTRGHADGESLRYASDAACSKQSSLTSADQPAVEAAVRHARDDREAEGREAYVRALEARVEHLQEMLRRQQSASNLTVSLRLPATARPSSTIIRAPVIDASSGVRVGRTTSGLVPPAPAAAAMTMRRVQPAGQRPPLEHATLSLPNARQSVLFQSIEDAHKAAAAAEEMEVARAAGDLELRRASLARQLAEVELQQARVAAVGPTAAQRSEPAAAAAAAARASEVVVGRLSGSRRGSGVLPEETGQRAVQRTTGVRVRTHRRTRSGSGGSGLRTSITPVLATSQPQRTPTSTALKAEEVAPGVFLTIEPDGEGYNRLTRIRFSRQHFSRDAADGWWHAHKHELARRFSLRASRPLSASAPAAPQQAHHLSPASTQFATPHETLQSPLGDGGPASPFSFAAGIGGGQSPRANIDTATCNPSESGGRESQASPHESENAGAVDGEKPDDAWLRKSREAAGTSEMSTEGFKFFRPRAGARGSPPAAGARALREHAVSPPTSDAGSTSRESSPVLWGGAAGAFGAGERHARAGKAVELPGPVSSQECESPSSPRRRRDRADDGRQASLQARTTQDSLESSQDESFGSARSSGLGEGETASEPRQTVARGSLLGGAGGLLGSRKQGGLAIGTPRGKHGPAEAAL